MIHIIGHIVFALGILAWLSWELKKPYNPTKHWGWLALTILFSVSGLALSFLSTSGLGIGNYLLHAIGGGMATAATYEYLRRSLNISFNWRIELAGLFMLVSSFGVLNELIEYAFEFAGYGIYSLSSQDTWKDFVANTTGALSVWLIIVLLQKISLGNHSNE
jgi:hypothetical protein